MTEHREKDVERFDQWSDTYEDSWLQRTLFDQAHRATLDLAGDIVLNPGVVLDVGCGTGRLLRQAHSYWPEAQLVGVDPAKGMIEVAKRLTPDATFHNGMAEALPLPDASVDLALSTISFHHWKDQAAVCARWQCASSWRILHSGGHLLPRLVSTSFP